jgi:hypothetical protein
MFLEYIKYLRIMILIIRSNEIFLLCQSAVDSTSGGHARTHTHTHTMLQADSQVPESI